MSRYVKAAIALIAAATITSAASATTVFSTGVNLSNGETPSDLDSFVGLNPETIQGFTLTADATNHRCGFPGSLF